MRVGRPWIECNIPHQGRMCLIDEVLAWDAHHIRCRSATHRAADHPLRSHGRLGAACGIEYAAQAMAVHGALAGSAAANADPAGDRVQAGFLASLRNVRLHVERLDDIESDLVCEAGLLAGDRQSALYGFTVTAAQLTLLTGRATVVFDAGRRWQPR